MSADPSLITGTQFDEAGDGGVPVSIIVAPKAAYTLTQGSLALFTDEGLTHGKIEILLEDDKYTFERTDFWKEKEDEKKYHTWLYAEFERAEGGHFQHLL